MVVLSLFCFAISMSSWIFALDLNARGFSPKVFSRHFPILACMAVWQLLRIYILILLSSGFEILVSYFLTIKFAQMLGLFLLR